MIIKLDNTELTCQGITKVYDMQNDRFNIVVNMIEANPDDDMYLDLLKSVHVLTLNGKEYSIINHDIMYNVRYEDDQER